MHKAAFLFPGQGSQYVGMGKEFTREFPISMDVFEEANDILGFNIKKLCFDGPEDELVKTENAQPSILTTSIAILRILEQECIECDITAGLSLGEYTSLVCTGALKFDDALKLVKNRGKYMQEAVPLGTGAMAAIIGLKIADVNEIIMSSKILGIVEIANYNSYEQIVISGEIQAVKYAVKKSKEHGASRAVILPTSAPFHCSLLQPAQKKLEKDLLKIELNKMRVPIVSNVNAKTTINEGGEVISLLIDQVIHPVLWKDSIETMLDFGIDTFLGIGPGDTTTKLVKKVVEYNGKEAEIYNINTVQELKDFLNIRILTSL